MGGCSSAPDYAVPVQAPPPYQVNEPGDGEAEGLSDAGQRILDNKIKRLRQSLIEWEQKERLAKANSADQRAARNAVELLNRQIAGIARQRQQQVQHAQTSKRPLPPRASSSNPGGADQNSVASPHFLTVASDSSRHRRSNSDQPGAPRSNIDSGDDSFLGGSSPGGLGMLPPRTASVPSTTNGTDQNSHDTDSFNSTLFTGAGDTQQLPLNHQSIILEASLSSKMTDASSRRFSDSQVASSQTQTSRSIKPSLVASSKSKSKPKPNKHVVIQGYEDQHDDEDEEVPEDFQAIVRTLSRGRTAAMKRLDNTLGSIRAGGGGPLTSSDAMSIRSADEDNYFEPSERSQIDASVSRPSKNTAPIPIEWRRGEVLGKGAFGCVHLGLNTITGQLMAVKQVPLEDEVFGNKADPRVMALEQEIAVLSALDNQHIVKYLGMETEEDMLNIFLEFVPGGSIASLLAQFGKFNETLVRVYTRQILEGLVYLHRWNLVHRDIKGGNILVDINGVCKLADFGASARLADLAKEKPTLQGTPYWMAPEVIKQQPQGRKIDIWSVGCTVIEMATGKPPWSEFSSHISALYHIATTEDMPHLPVDFSEEGKDFIRQCLTRDPVKRPNVFKLLQHPFVNSTTVHRPAPRSTQTFVRVHSGKMARMDHQPKSAVPAGNGERSVGTSTMDSVSFPSQLPVPSASTGPLIGPDTDKPDAFVAVMSDAYDQEVAATRVEDAGVVQGAFPRVQALEKKCFSADEPIDEDPGAEFSMAVYGAAVGASPLEDTEVEPGVAEEQVVGFLCHNYLKMVGGLQGMDAADAFA